MNRAVLMQHEGEHSPDEQNEASCVPEHNLECGGKVPI
jgi:hypothetical protein